MNGKKKPGRKSNKIIITNSSYLKWENLYITLKKYIFNSCAAIINEKVKSASEKRTCSLCVSKSLQTMSAARVTRERTHLHEKAAVNVEKLYV